MADELVGLVGTGRMGGPMGARLLDTGHRLVIHDKHKANAEPLLARGAVWASSPKEVADQAEIVLASLPTPDIVRTVALGPSGVIEGGKATIMVDLSTTGPGVARQVAAGLAERGVVSVDSPVSGGIKGAISGTLAVMVSCPKSTYERVAPILRTFGKLFFTGEKPGLAQSAKLANNLCAAAALAITSEAMAMAVKAGLDARVMIDILNVSSGRNSASEDKFPRAVLPGTFDFGFATGLSYKDVRLCVDEAEAMGVPMVVGAAVRQILAVTQATYGPDSDFTHIAKVLEGWADVEIRSPGRAG
jgi:3-hydroxyisobutyrate dehydrogenase-like beta-hydroxyacid dehydrogenase